MSPCNSRANTPLSNTRRGNESRLHKYDNSHFINSVVGCNIQI